MTDNTPSPAENQIRTLPVASRVQHMKDGIVAGRIEKKLSERDRLEARLAETQARMAERRARAALVTQIETEFAQAQAEQRAADEAEVAARHDEYKTGDAQLAGELAAAQAARAELEARLAANRELQDSIATRRQKLGQDRKTTLQELAQKHSNEAKDRKRQHATRVAAIKNGADSPEVAA